jgi:hypothetical protein
MPPFDVDDFSLGILGYQGSGLPELGRGMFVPSPSGAHVDPLHWIDPIEPGKRPLFGRWELYIDGFIEAGDRLVNGLRPEEMATPEGARLLYPIFFCYRQSLELKLKDLIQSVLDGPRHIIPGINTNARPKARRAASHKHGLKELWMQLKNLFPGCDAWASDETRNAFEALLSELDHHDEESQAARYPVTQKDKQSFVDLTNIDMGHLSVQVHKLAAYLGRVDHHLHRKAMEFLQLSHKGELTKEEEREW